MGEATFRNPWTSKSHNVPGPLDLYGSDVGHHGAIGFVVFDDVDQLMTIGVQQITKHLAVGTWKVHFRGVSSQDHPPFKDIWKGKNLRGRKRSPCLLTTYFRPGMILQVRDGGSDMGWVPPRMQVSPPGYLFATSRDGTHCLFWWVTCVL